jgi:hypothetical protein
MNNTEIKNLICKTVATHMLNKYNINYEEVFEEVFYHLHAGLKYNAVADCKAADCKSDITINDFTQSQSHGLFWDNEIRQKVFGLPLCKNDTKKFDIDCHENKFNHSENISIKTSGCNNIDCGDIVRFYDRDRDKNKDITIMLIRYSQINNQKTIKEIMEINYNEQMKNILFGDVTRDVLESYVKHVKDIPSGIVSDETKKDYKNKKNEIQEQYKMRINISPKVDSKSQRRVQCSITKIDELFDKYPQFILSRTKEPVIRGVLISSTIDSSKRIRA